MINGNTFERIINKQIRQKKMNKGKRQTTSKGKDKNKLPKQKKGETYKKK